MTAPAPMVCDMCKRSDREVARVSRPNGIHFACVDQPACADDWWKLMQEYDAEKKARRAARARELRAVATARYPSSAEDATTERTMGT